MTVVTISRGTGSGGAALARELGERLGARVLSHEVIVEAARAFGVNEEDLDEALSSPPSLWDRFRHQTERQLLAVRAALAEMVQTGNVVYYGLGGAYLLAGLPGVVKVRLIAPIELRLQGARGESCFESEEAARRHIEAVDERRARWVRLVCGVEWSDPSLYDLVLNLAHLSVETACEAVVDLAGRREYRRDPEIEQRRRDFALETRLQAELALRSGFPRGGVTVQVRRGKLLLSGSFFDSSPDKVLAFVRELPGASEALPSTVEVAPEREETVRDVMLPIASYPVIRKDRPIREAIVAISGSSVKLSDGQVYRPRYILVHDEVERVVGVVARRSLLRGLTPQLRDLDRVSERIRSLGGGIVDFSFPLSFRWASLFGPAARAAAEDPVETVMSPIRCTVRPDDPLSSVVITMLQHDVDLVPVVAESTTIGVVVMTEIFDAVAEHHVVPGS